MNIYQKRVRILLQEVIEICNKGNIPWFVSGRSAIRTYSKEIFWKSFLDVEITIPVEYALKFLQAYEEQEYENRVVESLLNNANFPGFFFKYIDKETTLVRLNEGNATKYKGIFIKILFLRKRPIDQAALDLGKKYERLICDTSNQFLEYSGDCTFRERMKFRILRKQWGISYTRRIFEKLVKIYGDPNSEFVLVTSLQGEDVNFEKNRFECFELFSYNNLVLQIPENPEEYFVKISDENWEKYLDDIILEGKEATMIVEGANNLVSEKLSFEQMMIVFRQNGFNNRLFRIRKKNSKKNSKHKQLSVLAGKTWNLAQRAGDLWLIHDEYWEEKTKILKLFEARQMDELKSIFDKYDEVVRKYAQLQMGFLYDRTLWEIYLYLLESYNEIKFGNTVKKLVAEDEELRIQLATMNSILETGEENESI